VASVLGAARELAVSYASALNQGGEKMIVMGRRTAVSALFVLLLSNPAVAQLSQAETGRAQVEMQIRIERAVDSYVQKIGMRDGFVSYCQNEMHLQSATHPKNGIIPFGVSYSNITDRDQLHMIIGIRENYERSYLILCLARAKKLLSEAESLPPLK
jgi:hypothetical protein